jgi:hypothetical protein
MKNTIFGLLLIAFGTCICVRREWVATKLQRFYSNYPLIRLAGQEQLRSRGGFIIVLGLVFAGIGVFGIADEWLF